LGDGFVVIGFPLRLDVRNDFVNFSLVDVRAVNAQQARRTWRQEKHVATAEQMFGSVRVQNRARIDFRRNPVRHAGREVGLDQSRDDIN
jgi:hypothetical protein